VGSALDLPLNAAEQVPFFAEFSKDYGGPRFVLLKNPIMDFIDHYRAIAHRFEYITPIGPQPNMPVTQKTLESLLDILAPMEA
jgi:hypothetical protein